jgi:hypothetical protein
MCLKISGNTGPNRDVSIQREPVPLAPIDLTPCCPPRRRPQILVAVAPQHRWPPDQQDATGAGEQISCGEILQHRLAPMGRKGHVTIEDNDRNHHARQRAPSPNTTGYEAPLLVTVAASM